MIIWIQIDLALNDLQWVSCHKTKPNKIKSLTSYYNKKTFTNESTFDIKITDLIFLNKKAKPKNFTFCKRKCQGKHEIDENGAFLVVVVVTIKAQFIIALDWWLAVIKTQGNGIEKSSKASVLFWRIIYPHQDHVWTVPFIDAPPYRLILVLKHLPLLEVMSSAFDC